MKRLGGSWKRHSRATTFRRRWHNGWCRPALECLEDRTLPSALLDPTFGRDGKLLTDVGSPGGSLANAPSVVCQPDGKILVAAAHWTHTVVVRYNPDGNLDSGFGNGGTVRLDLYGGNLQSPRVALDSHGRILVLAVTNLSSSPNMLARLTPDGSLDPAFDGDGLAGVDFGASFFGIDVAVDSHDRVIVTGHTYQGGAIVFAVARFSAVDGSLDLGFDGDGKATVGFNGTSAFAKAVAVDALDRIVVAGYTSSGYPTSDFAVARLLASDGRLDSTFGNAGTKSIDFGAWSEEAYDVAIDSANNVVVAGSITKNSLGGDVDFAVTRLLGTNGNLDPNFDGDGKASVDFGGFDPCYSLAVDSADNVVLAGRRVINNVSDFALARLAGTNGTLLSWGKRAIDFNGNSEYGLTGVTVDNNGNIVAVGASAGTISGVYGIYLAAVRILSADGSLDPTFDGDGRVLTPNRNPGSNDQAYSVALQADGKIIVAGTGYDQFNQGNFAIVVRYNSDGSLDSSFGLGGVFHDTSISLGSMITIDSRGRILLVGGNSSSDLAVARLLPNGSLDPNFDGDGRAIIAFDSGADWGVGVAMDDADNVIVAGWSQQAASIDFVVARLLGSNGSLDPSFDGDGRATIDFGSAPDYGYGVAIDSANRIIVAGRSDQATGADFAVARLLGSNGSLDPAFGNGGKKLVDFGGAYDEGFSVAVDVADNPIVAGYSYQGAATGYDFAVARLLAADGNLDPSFNGDGLATVDFGSLNDFGWDVVLDSSGNVLVAGWSDQGYPTYYDFALAKLSGADGSLVGLDGDGRATVNFSSTSDGSSGVAIDGSDRVILAGMSLQYYLPTQWSWDFAVARLYTKTPPTADAGGHAPFFYATSEGGANLVSIDQNTGVATTIGSLGYQSSFTGAFTADGRFWTIVNSYHAGQLAEVNLSTGQATPVGAPPVTNDWIISLDANSRGQLFAGSHSGTYYSVNTTTGQFTPISQLGIYTCDFAFDTSGNLWAVDGSSTLYQLDPSTGAPLSSRQMTGLPDCTMSIEVDSANRFYVATCSYPAQLYRLDPATGAATLVGSNLGVNYIHGGDFLPALPGSGAYAVDEDATVQLAGWGIDLQDGSSGLTYEWDFDADGQFDDAIGPNPLFSAAGLEGPGTIAVSLRVTDSDGDSSVDTATVIVNPVNDAPIVAAPRADVVVDEDASDTVVDLAGVFTDVDILSNADVLTLMVTNSNSSLVSATLVGTTLTLDYIADWNGTAQITVRATDLAGAYVEDAVLVTVNPVNDRPAALPQSANVSEDGQVAVTLSGSDVETPLRGLVFTITSLPVYGSFKRSTGESVAVNDAFVGPPTLIYEPGAAWEAGGSDSFRFTVTDDGDPAGSSAGPLASSPAIVGIAITPAVAPGQVTIDAAGVVRIGGTSAADVIQIKADKSNTFLKVTFNSVVVSSAIPLVTISEIRAWGRAGNDNIVVSGVTINSLIHGGADNDTLGGASGSDVIFGGLGGDTITGGNGIDFVIGGDGADSISCGGGTDILAGGDVAWRLTESALRAVLQAWSLYGTANLGSLTGGMEPALLDNDYDTLTGGMGRDWLILDPADLITDLNRKKRDGDLVTEL